MPVMGSSCKQRWSLACLPTTHLLLWGLVPNKQWWVPVPSWGVGIPGFHVPFRMWILWGKASWNCFLSWSPIAACSGGLPLCLEHMTRKEWDLVRSPTRISEVRLWASEMLIPFSGHTAGAPGFTTGHTSSNSLRSGSQGCWVSQHPNRRAHLN